MEDAFHEHLGVSAALVAGVCPSHSRDLLWLCQEWVKGHWAGGRLVQGQTREPLTHTAGTALLRLSHGLGAVDGRAVEAVTAHVGILKGTQGSVLLQRAIASHRPLLKPPSRPWALHSLFSLQWDKSDKFHMSSLPSHLLTCVAHSSMFLPPRAHTCLDLHRSCVP